MLTGWERQQRARLLAASTIKARVDLVRRFAAWLVDVRRADTTRAFWSWATRTRHLPPLDIPTKTSSEPSQFTPDDDRWALARRMLHNAAIPTADRVAALLDYARQLPPPVIGRLLGLAPGTV